MGLDTPSPITAIIDDIHILSYHHHPPQGEIKNLCHPGDCSPPPQKYKFLWVMPQNPGYRSRFLFCFVYFFSVILGLDPRTQVIVPFYTKVCFALLIHLVSGLRVQNDKSFYVLFLRTPFLITSLSLRAIAWQSS